MNRKLTLEELEYVRKEIEQKGKRTEFTYILAVLLGFLGVHLGYMEKRKMAVTRAILSISTLILIFLANTTVEVLWSTELTMRLQQYSSALTVIMSGLLIIQLIWIIYDLSSIPKEINKINQLIEKDATTSVIQSRYAAETVRKEETSKFIIDEVTKKVDAEFEEKIYSEVELAESKVNFMLDSLEKSDKDVSVMRSEIDEKTQHVYDNMKKDLLSVKNNINEEVVELNNTIKIYNETEEEYLKIHKRLETQSASVQEKLEMEEELKDLLPKLRKALSEHSANSDLNARVNKMEGTLKSNLKALEDLKNIKKVRLDKSVTNKQENSESQIANAGKTSRKISHESQDKGELFLTPETPTTEKEVLSDVSSNHVSDEKGVKPKGTNYSERETLSVENAIEEQGVVTVSGYIVGEMRHGKVLLKSKFNSNSNVVISDSTNPSDTDSLLVIQLLGKSNLRQLYGLKGNPEAMGTRITVTGVREKYFNSHGLKKVDSVE